MAYNGNGSNGPKGLPVVLEKAEAESLLAQPNTRCRTGCRNRAILEVMYRAGLRVGEACRLKPAHIRWDEAILEVRRGKGKRDRMIPVEAQTLDKLREWQANRPKSRWLFCTIKGEPGQQLSTRYVQQFVKELARKAGIENWEKVSPHTLRHSYATGLLSEGFNIREVQTLLGHADVSSTQIYTHVSPTGLAEKIRRRGEDPTKAQAASLLKLLPENVRQALLEILAGGNGELQGQ